MRVAFCKQSSAKGSCPDHHSVGGRDFFCTTREWPADSVFLVLNGPTQCSLSIDPQLRPSSVSNVHIP